MNQLRWWFGHSPMKPGISLYLTRRDPKTQTTEYAEVVWHERGDGLSFQETVHVDRDELAGFQELMDQMWGFGLRPSVVRYQEGKIEAVQTHLDDMRAIVFEKLKVPKP